MIDSNQNDFAGAMPVSESTANWNWLKDRVQTNNLDTLHNWLEDQLLELEAEYEGWVSPKSRQLAMQNELRSSRS